MIRAVTDAVGLRAIIVTTLIACCQCHAQDGTSSRLEASRASLASFAERFPEQLPAALGRLAGSEQSERDLAVAWLDSLALDDKVALLRAVLWHADPLVAGGAALLVQPRWLDVEESRRVVELLLPRALTLPPPFDIAEFGALLTPKDISRELLLDVPLAREAVQFLPALHHSLRQEHIPLLADVTRSDDLILRGDALRFLSVLANYTEHAPHLDLIALAVLSWNHASTAVADRDPTTERIEARPLAIRLPAHDGAIPRTLAALLRRLWLEPIPDALAAFRPMARRWLLSVRATAADLPLLAEFLSVEDTDLLAVLARHFADSAEETSRERLLALSTHTDDTVRAIALSALARRGSSTHRDALRDLANAGVVPAIAELLGHGTSAIVSLGEWLDAKDSATAIQRAKAMVEALEPERSAVHPRAEDALWRLRDALNRRPPAAAAAAVLVAAIPHLRSDRLCTAAVRSLDSADLDANLLAVLELFDRDLIVDRLRAASAACADPKRRRALDSARARLGDPAESEAMLAVFDADSQIPRTWLARSRSEALRTELEARLKSASRHDDERALAAIEVLAVLDGMDDVLAAGLMTEVRNQIDSLNLPVAASRLVERAQSLGAEAALREYLSLRPNGAPVLHRSGALATPSVLAWLQRAREDRAAGHYREATLEAARAGDSEALAELRRAHALELYRWIDDLPADALGIENRRPDPVRWYPMLAGNCCAFAAIASRLEDWYELDAFRKETGLRSRIDLVREIFQDARLEWRFSERERRYFRFPKP